MPASHQKLFFADKTADRRYFPACSAAIVLPVRPSSGRRPLFWDRHAFLFQQGKAEGAGRSSVRRLKRLLMPKAKVIQKPVWPSMARSRYIFNTSRLVRGLNTQVIPWSRGVCGSGVSSSTLAFVSAMVGLLLSTLPVVEVCLGNDFVVHDMRLTLGGRRSRLPEKFIPPVHTDTGVSFSSFTINLLCGDIAAAFCCVHLQIDLRPQLQQRLPGSSFWDHRFPLRASYTMRMLTPSFLAARSTCRKVRNGIHKPRCAGCVLPGLQSSTNFTSAS